MYEHMSKLKRIELELNWTGRRKFCRVFLKLHLGRTGRLRSTNCV